MMRHSVNKWKLEQVMITGVITVEMVANAFLCDRGRSDNVLPDTEFQTLHVSGSMYTVEGIKVAEDITFRESQSDALSDVGRTHSSNEGQAEDTPNLCRRVEGETVRGENLIQRRGSGSGLDRVEVNSTITPIGSKEDTRTVSTAETAIKRSLVTVYEDSGTTAGSRNRWR